MRTTLDLPEELLAKAMKVSKAETKTSVIVLALEELVRKSTLANLKQYKGKVALDIDLDQSAETSLMDVLVDSSVWIDYFKGAARSAAVDTLIDENLVVINDVILTELVPFMVMKRQKALVNLLQEVRRLPLHINWNHIMELQLLALRSGSNGIGIPDLIIVQNVRQHDCVLYSLDKPLLSLAARLKIATVN